MYDFIAPAMVAAKHLIPKRKLRPVYEIDTNRLAWLLLDSPKMGPLMFLDNQIVRLGIRGNKLWKRRRELTATIAGAVYHMMTGYCVRGIPLPFLVNYSLTTATCPV